MRFPRVAFVALVLACSHPRWVGTWSASPQDTDEPLQISGATVRYTVRLSVGGERVRLRANNSVSTQPLRLGAVHLAWLGPNGREDRLVPFQPSVAPGSVAVSDPVEAHLPDLTEVQISVYFPAPTALTTEHSISLGSTQVSLPGDFTASEVFPVKEVIDSIGPVLDLEVEGQARAIVVVGDSLADGVGSTAGAHHRWTERLAERLLASGRRHAVLNQGVGGARLLHDFIGLSGLARFDRDVLSKAGVGAVIVELGLNDLGIPGAFEDFRARWLRSTR